MIIQKCVKKCQWKSKSYNQRVRGDASFTKPFSLSNFATAELHDCAIGKLYYYALKIFLNPECKKRLYHVIKSHTHQEKTKQNQKPTGDQYIKYSLTKAWNKKVYSCSPANTVLQHEAAGFAILWPHRPHQAWPGLVLICLNPCFSLFSWNQNYQWSGGCYLLWLSFCFPLHSR